MRTRNIVIIVTSVCSVVMLAIGLSIWLVYSIVTGGMLGLEPPPTPAQLKEARVVAGRGFLSRSVFIETGLGQATKDMGRITDVKVGELDPHPGLDVVVAASNGALVMDRNAVKQGRAVFRYPVTTEKVGPFGVPRVDNVMGAIQVVDLEGDGNCEYVARGSVHGAAVFDHQGLLLWTYGHSTNQKTYLDDLAIGDLDGDGIAEFVVSWDGIEIFDKSGNRRSQITERYGDSQIEVVDTDGDGRNEIVSVGGSMKIRNAKGEVIKEVPLSGYIGHFDLCHMPGGKEPGVMTVYGRQVWLMDLKGDMVIKFDAPFSVFDDTIHQTPLGESRGTTVYKSRGVWIKLAPDQPEYLAVIKDFAAIDRAVLDVYTQTGQLVYQEVLPEECLSIAVLPPVDASGVAELLVAGQQTVWRYRHK